MTSIIKMRGAVLATPVLTLNDIPFSRQKCINWLGADSVTISEYGVESINDYQNGQVYPSIDTAARTRVCKQDTENGINVLTFSPENFPVNPLMPTGFLTLNSLMQKTHCLSQSLSKPKQVITRQDTGLFFISV